MESLLLLSGVVLIACAISQKLFAKTSVPGLLIFIVLGMIFGSDGLIKVHFDNYELAGQICTIALVLIMYYGGIDTNLRAARPVMVKAVALSSLGSFITAGLVTLFAIYVLRFDPIEGFLLGCVICSTDAASVFSILRSRQMNLKYGTASILEVESGSNDPFSYMLTVVALTMLSGGDITALSILKILGLQVFVGAAFGILTAEIIKRLLPLLNLRSSTLTDALLLGTALITYTAANHLAGNGFLAVYLAGIIIGNSQFDCKNTSIHFFDDLTGLMQMLLFFMLGLLSFPSRFPAIAVPALGAALFLTFVARPIAVALVLKPLRARLSQILFISFAGMRGAASIAFAIMAVSRDLTYDLFHMVFFIVLFSILVQGSLLPLVATKLDIIDDDENVMATFNDYTREVPVQFVKFIVTADHPWRGQPISSIILPPGSIIAAIQRHPHAGMSPAADHTSITAEATDSGHPQHSAIQQLIPKGDTILECGDELILCGLDGGEASGQGLREITITNLDDWKEKRLRDLNLHGELIVLIIREGRTIIPTGDTQVLIGDRLYMLAKK